MTRRVDVIGAGIAGLTLALALARRGHSVRVLEGARGFGAVGAGIQISPNGWAVLAALGLEGLAERAVRNRGVVLLDGPTGRDVVRMDLEGAPYFLFHRADLLAGLLEAMRAAGVRIETGRRLETVTDGARAAMLFANGAEAEAEFVVGADGLHSAVRGALEVTDKPFFTRQVAWRAVIAGQAAPEARVEMGPGRHLVSYPLTEGRVNLVGVEERADWTAEGWHHSGDPEAFRAAFAGFPGAEARLARVEQCHVWGLFRHGIARRWHGRSVAILGDAAHPTLPFLAQGANLALEDAWTLASALDAEAPGALEAWQGARIPRVTRAIRAANDNARNYHLDGPKRRAAHLALRAAGRLAPGALTRRFDWLYGHDVTAQ